MSSEGSVTHWMRRLEEGDRQAAHALWERYFRRLVSLARSELQGAPRRVADEEDVALSALASFFRGAEDGRFTDLLDRESLWRLLVHITAHKAVDHARRHGAQIRGGDRAPPITDADLEQVIGREPTPEFAAQFADELRRLLARLTDSGRSDAPLLRSVAILRLENYTIDEIAAELHYAPATIDRKLRVIRSLLASEIEP